MTLPYFLSRLQNEKGKLNDFGFNFRVLLLEEKEKRKRNFSFACGNERERGRKESKERHGVQEESNLKLKDDNLQIKPRCNY